MADQAVFAPKAEFTDPECLGTVFVSDKGDFNVREAVEAGDGVIVVTDQKLIEALDRYLPLTRVAASVSDDSGDDPVTEDNDDPLPEDTDSLDGLTRAQLLKLPEAKSVSNARALNAEPLREAIAEVRATDQGQDD